MNGLYKGISTANYIKNNVLSLTDIELVKQNIINHIYTRKGERVYMPEWGTIIPDLLFEPLDNTMLGLIESELMDVINADPRVELIDFKITPMYNNNMIAVSLDLYYVELDSTDRLSVSLKFGEN